MQRAAKGGQRGEDRIEHRLLSETRDGLDEILEPYKDGIRDKMLDMLPIETRRQLEEEKRKREE